MIRGNLEVLDIFLDLGDVSYVYAYVCIYTYTDKWLWCAVEKKTAIKGLSECNK